MKTLLVCAAAAALMMAVPRSAHACGGGHGGYGGYGPSMSSSDVLLLLASPYLGAADLAFTIGDLVRASGPHAPEKLYGVLELIVAAPQLGLGVYALGHSLGTDGSNAGLLVGYTAWMALLTTHAIWTLAGPSDEPPRQFVLGPTYAPVGQQAKPGFGLSGRF
jgi:hypothetical protein